MTALRSAWLVVLVLGVLSAHAQNAVLRGVVLDAETHQPIPYAQVGVADNRIGTSTNEDGRFALSIPPAYAQERLTVALLGYRSYRQPLPPLPGPELRIELHLSPAALGEVQVTGSVLGIVREAVARIPRNYPGRPTQLTGFYRESDNDSLGRPRYLVEGLLTVYKAPYQQRTNDGEVQIRQSRKVDLRPAGELVRIDWAGGPFIAHRADFVHSRAQFITPARFRDYDYRLAPGSTYQDRPVYVITFGPKPGNRRATFEGRLYIDQDSYAFLGAEWHLTKAGRARDAAESRALRVTYQPYAGHWHLKSVWWKTAARLPLSPLLYYFGEFLTTCIDTAQAPRPTYLEQAQFNDVFVRNTVAYDSAFWQSHTTLLPPEALRQALLDQARQRRADSLFRQPEAAADASSTRSASSPQAESGWTRLFSRLSYGVSVGGLPVAVAAGQIALDLAPAGYRLRAQGLTTVAAQRLVWWHSAEYGYDLTPNLRLRLATQQVFRQFEGQGWEVGLSYQRNLNPRHRPVFGRAGLAFTRLSVARSLGTHANPDDDLRLAGTHLGADELAVQLQARTTAVQPKLGLGFELSHRLELVADAGYLLPLRTSSQLQVEESSGFFLTRSAATLGLPASEADLRLNGQPLTTAPWQLSRWVLGVGLLLRVH